MQYLNRIRHPAFVADQVSESCSLTQELAKQPQPLDAAPSRQVAGDLLHTVEAETRAGMCNRSDQRFPFVIDTCQDCLRGIGKQLVQELGKRPQQVHIVTDMPPRLAARDGGHCRSGTVLLQSVACALQRFDDRGRRL